jgi:hypothetical protein
MGIFARRPLKIHFDIRVRKSTIIQVDAQFLRGNCSLRKQGADRFKNDSMLRLNERARAKGLDEILPQIARDRFIAQRAERFKFSRELCFAIHVYPRGKTSLP